MKKLFILCLMALMLVLTSCGGEQKQGSETEQIKESEVLETTADTTTEDDGWSEVYRP